MENLRSIQKTTDIEIRPSPRLVAALLAVFALATSLFGDEFLPDAGTLKMPLFAMYLYVAAALVFIADLFNPKAGRFAAVAATIGVVAMGVFWLEMPAFLVFVPLPILFAAIVSGLPAAAIAAASQTIPLLLLTATPQSVISPQTGWLTIIVMWITFTAMVVQYYPIYQLLNWFAVYFQQARQSLEEARDRKAELEHVLNDLAHANRELALLTERLGAMRQVAEEAHNAKAAFVAKISHEFRTPLNMIIGLIDTLTETPEIYGQELPPVLLKDLEIVHRNSTYLASMINDVLDLSQTETGRLQLHPELGDLVADIASATMVVRPLLEKKNLTLTIDAPSELPPVSYDRTRIRQVILNLVSNAARYTETGGITVTAQPQDSDVVISVSDTGAGILAEDARRIFEPFYRGEGRLRGDRDGSGLGLSICEQLVAIHHGKIWLDTELGKGSTFTFTLPVTASSQAGAAAKGWIRDDWVFQERTVWPSIPTLPYHQRLVVCDETGILYPILRHNYSDIEFVNAKNLPQTLDALEECPAHAIIINTASGNDNGNLIDEIRQQTPDTPVIGCSFPPHLNQAIAGAMDYLVKPVRRIDLENLLKRLEQPPRRILIVDDNPDIRDLFQRMLRSINPSLRILVAVDGAEAMNMMRQKSPDLILLDVIMPQMDGFEVLLAKQADETIREIPVALVSAEDPARQPMSSDNLVMTMGAGISLNKLVDCSLNFSELMLQPAQAPDPMLQ